MGNVYVMNQQLHKKRKGGGGCEETTADEKAE